MNEIELYAMYLCDTGVYNGVIRGYLIAAMQNAGFEHEKISNALKGLEIAFDEKTAAEAAEIDRKF